MDAPRNITPRQQKINTRLCLLTLAWIVKSLCLQVLATSIKRWTLSYSCNWDNSDGSPRKKETTPMLPLAYIIVSLHFWVGPSLYGALKRALQELKGPSFQRCTPWTGMDKLANTYLPQEQYLHSHMIGWKYLIHADTPTIIGWTIGGRVHQKPSARKVIHLRNILALRDLTMEFLWDLG